MSTEQQPDQQQPGTAVARTAPAPIDYSALSEGDRGALVLGDVFARSGYFADARQQSQAAVKIMLGQALGLPAVVAMAQVSVIDGRPTIGSTAIAAMLRNHGYDYRVLRLDDDGCELRFWRGRAEDGEQLVPDVKFDRADAERANLLGKNNWQHYPRSMFFARCVSAGARMHAPEVAAGLPLYDPDELGGGDAVATAVEVPAAPEQPQPEPVAAEPAPQPQPAPQPAAASPAAPAPEPAEPAAAAAPADDPEPEPSPEVAELLALGRNELRDRVKSAGLSPTGTKRELAERLAAAAAEQAAADAADDEPADVELVPDDEQPDPVADPPAAEPAGTAPTPEPEPDDAAEQRAADDAAAEQAAAEQTGGPPPADGPGAVTADEPQPTGEAASADQRRRLFDAFRAAGCVQEPAQRALIEWLTGAESTDRIPADQVDGLLERVPNWRRELAQLAQQAQSDERAARAFRHLDTSGDATHEG